MFICIITIYVHNKPIKYNQRYNKSHFKISTENYDFDKVGGKAGFRKSPNLALSQVHELTHYLYLHLALT